MLAVRIVQQQGFEVDAFHIRTIFECCKTRAARAAVDLGVRLTVLSVADDYIDVIRRPAHGYGKGVNPCVDCRIYMCKMAKRFMEQVDACAVVTGEVLGQRPMSQKRRDLSAVAAESGLDGRLLRPLSAMLLPPTIPENEGLINREKLYAFTGRGRRSLIGLARQLGIREIPQPSTGCALTEVTFAPRVRDLIRFHHDATRGDFELLNVGRHVRIDQHTKVVLGRNETENLLLRRLFQPEEVPNTALLHPENFLGPDLLVVGRVTAEAIEFAAALILRYSKRFDPEDAQVQVTQSGTTRRIRARPEEATWAAKPL